VNPVCTANVTVFSTQAQRT